jgi:hypothetical protein
MTENGPPLPDALESHRELPEFAGSGEPTRKLDVPG